MRLNSAKRCSVRAWVRHISQHRRFGTFRNVVKCFLQSCEARCLNAGLSFHLLRMRASKAPASPYICASYSPEPALLTNVRHQMQV